ncbi:MAG: thioesterase family protein [Muribaculaceae bacterium]|nr:thioesterase family protein [Muribaculaceae bacterium]
MDRYIFELEMKVRDYEVDCENIVNNAVYLHYLEHTRHEFCNWVGFSFKEMHLKGIDPVLNKVEIEYKTPLTCSDIMVSKLWIEMKGPRFIFHQDIYKKTTCELVVKAIVSCVCIENGKLTRGEILAEAFKNYL